MDGGECGGRSSDAEAAGQLKKEDGVDERFLILQSLWREQQTLLRDQEVLKQGFDAQAGVSARIDSLRRELQEVEEQVSVLGSAQRSDFSPPRTPGNGAVDARQRFSTSIPGQHFEDAISAFGLQNEIKALTFQNEALHQALLNVEAQLQRCRGQGISTDFVRMQCDGDQNINLMEIEVAKLDSKIGHLRRHSVLHREEHQDCLKELERELEEANAEAKEQRHALKSRLTAAKIEGEMLEAELEGTARGSQSVLQRLAVEEDQLLCKVRDAIENAVADRRSSTRSGSSYVSLSAMSGRPSAQLNADGEVGDISFIASADAETFSDTLFDELRDMSACSTVLLHDVGAGANDGLEDTDLPSSETPQPSPLFGDHRASLRKWRRRSLLQSRVSSCGYSMPSMYTGARPGGSSSSRLSEAQGLSSILEDAQVADPPEHVEHDDSSVMSGKNSTLGTSMADHAAPDDWQSGAPSALETQQLRCMAFSSSPASRRQSRATRRRSTACSAGEGGPSASPRGTTGDWGSDSKQVLPSVETNELADGVPQAPAAAHADDLKAGDRVLVRLGKYRELGTLRYIGLTRFAAGEWCGVELDKPLGKNDGSMRDERLFTCEPRHGIFVRSVMLCKFRDTDTTAVEASVCNTSSTAPRPATPTLQTPVEPDAERRTSDVKRMAVEHGMSFREARHKTEEEITQWFKEAGIDISTTASAAAVIVEVSTTVSATRSSSHLAQL